MKLYASSYEDRCEAREHLLTCLALFCRACAEEIEWDDAVHAGLDLRERRRKSDAKLTGDEVELLTFAHAQLALWQHRRVQADRLLASAEDIYTHAHRHRVADEEPRVDADEEFFAS
jgi:hypothetical protein